MVYSVPGSVRDVLLQEKKRLEDVLGTSHPFNVGEGFEKTDLFSVRAVQCFNHKATSERLQDVTAALKRWEEGTFGICVDCHEPINPDRLGAHPEVKRCASCQKRAETHPRKYW